MTAKLAALRAGLRDERANRVVFVSHCILNENVRYLGGAFRQGAVDEVVDGLQHAGVGIHQMPCPEQRAWGGALKRSLVPMYASRGTVVYRFRHLLAALLLSWTRLVYARLARHVVRDIADYLRSGVEVVGIIGVAASPSCGVFRTLDVGGAVEVLAGCDLRALDPVRFNQALLAAALRQGQGRFVEVLRRELARRKLDVPFYEHDLIAEMRGGTVPPVQVPCDLSVRSHATTRGREALFASVGHHRPTCMM